MARRRAVLAKLWSSRTGPSNFSSSKRWVAGIAATTKITATMKRTTQTSSSVNPVGPSRLPNVTAEPVVGIRYALLNATVNVVTALPAVGTKRVDVHARRIFFAGIADLIGDTPWVYWQA